MIMIIQLVILHECSASRLNISKWKKIQYSTRARVEQENQFNADISVYALFWSILSYDCLQ